jgi:hypothetical protein
MRKGTHYINIFHILKKLQKKRYKTSGAEERFVNTTLLNLG